MYDNYAELQQVNEARNQALYGASRNVGAYAALPRGAPVTVVQRASTFGSTPAPLRQSTSFDALNAAAQRRPTASSDRGSVHVSHSVLSALDVARFVSLQTPLAVELVRIAAFPFSPVSTATGGAVTFHCKFELSGEQHVLLGGGAHALHARMFGVRGGDIQWLPHCWLKLNDELIDVSANSKKLRTKSAVNALVMPLAANLTRAARRGVNEMHFRAATLGDVGLVVVQLVRVEPPATAAVRIAASARRLTYRAAMAAAAIGAASARINVAGNDNDDDDVQEQAYMATLNDPVSFVRITTPVRGTACRHAQCFDLATYVDFSHHNQYFNCPVCRLPTPVSELCVDTFFAEMLATLRDDEEDKVIINADGTFVAASAPPSAAASAAAVVQRALAVNTVDALDVDALADANDTPSPARTVSAPVDARHDVEPVAVPSAISQSTHLSTSASARATTLRDVDAHADAHDDFEAAIREFLATLDADAPSSSLTSPALPPRVHYVPARVADESATSTTTAMTTSVNALPHTSSAHTLPVLFERVHQSATTAAVPASLKRAAGVVDLSASATQTTSSSSKRARTTPLDTASVIVIDDD